MKWRRHTVTARLIRSFSTIGTGSQGSEFMAVSVDEIIPTPHGVPT
ncbi:MAG: hypothetical protein R2826_06440 [Thermoleophilia bacterium]